ncbi:MAG: DUF1957 domain-containing protein [Treponema sp.]|jgi:1,4-alpha-glucan branching enzyme|nr:DUF1957 domain-containing protein [Treponema sp.]
MSSPVVTLVLHGHAPFVRHCEQINAPQESWFFESISETYIPLLLAFERLERDRIPFRVGLSLSPTLCHMLSDEQLIQRYIDFTGRQIEFGGEELKRNSKNGELYDLIKIAYDKVVDNHFLFTERYEKNLLKAFELFQKKGRIELLGTAATHAFLPFYTAYPEAIQAQFEVSLATYRDNFGKSPQGFWLPELGWKSTLESWLRAYNFGYTIVDSHALAFAHPAAKKGTFHPVRSPGGIFVFGRDFYAGKDLQRMTLDPDYRDNRRDQGFELPSKHVKPFLSQQGTRSKTGYKYWANGEDGLAQTPYDLERALSKAKIHAKEFLAERLKRLQSADKLVDGVALSLCAFEADSLGRFWHEGEHFLEALFREGAENGNVQFLTPSEYLCRQDTSAFQTVSPEFSSWGEGGYAETWLDATNDWMYCHIKQAHERMVEMSERFPNSTSLKERALNQAARELLLVIASDWPKMLHKQESSDYARLRVENSLRNFTTIYEALGGSYISTEWLTQLERRNNIFPNINYRVFRRKL